MKIKTTYKYVPYLVALISGTIYTLCAMRVMDSLARHGTIAWRSEIYLTKLILILTFFLVYKYIQNQISSKNISSISGFLKYTYPNTILLILSIIFAIWQFQGRDFMWTLLRPIRVLFFVW